MSSFLLVLTIVLAQAQGPAPAQAPDAAKVERCTRYAKAQTRTSGGDAVGDTARGAIGGAIVGGIVGGAEGAGAGAGVGGAAGALGLAGRSPKSVRDKYQFYYDACMRSGLR
jgi:hypothetical protein